VIRLLKIKYGEKIMKKYIALMAVVIGLFFVSCSKPEFSGKVVVDIINADCATVGCADFTIRVETDKVNTSVIKAESVSHFEYEYNASLYVWAQTSAIIEEAGSEVNIKIYRDGAVIAESHSVASASEYGNTLPARLFAVVAKEIIE
jgi:hypothetical protein